MLCPSSSPQDWAAILSGRAHEWGNSHFQVSTNGDWLTDYPDPSSIFPRSSPATATATTTCSAIPRSVRCDTPNRSSSARRAPQPALWTAIDRAITNQAGWVPTVTPRIVDLVSARVGNYEFNPVWAFLLDQSWVR
jgi:peptide/nickel transport system substrate-binding protein